MKGLYSVTNSCLPVCLPLTYEYLEMCPTKYRKAGYPARGFERFRGLPPRASCFQQNHSSALYGIQSIHLMADKSIPKVIKVHTLDRQVNLSSIKIEAAPT